MKQFSAILGLFVIAAVAVVAFRGQHPSTLTIAARQISATAPDAIEIPAPFPAETRRTPSH